MSSPKEVESRFVSLSAEYAEFEPGVRSTDVVRVTLVIDVYTFVGGVDVEGWEVERATTWVARMYDRATARARKAVSRG